MEAAFNSLKGKKKNDLDGIITWLKEAKIIDGKKVTEEKARKLFGDAQGAIEYPKFKEAIGKLAEESKCSVDVYTAQLCETRTALDDAFEKLKKDGKNNVDNILQWMKDSKIVDGAKDSEEKARKMLAEMKAKAEDVDIEKFKETVSKMADEQKTKFENLASTVAAQGPKLMSAFGAATSAFKDAMNK